MAQEAKMGAVVVCAALSRRINGRDIESEDKRVC